ncbi:PepSY domain-containing protein [Microvirga flocculans]|uniref:PepSY domain-containing protein n=1 Tax=Microvirga flocculans TaxID=217168 RepID=UPI003F644833
MVRNLVWAAILSVCLGAAPVAAGERCNVPLADWQPREALQKKLADEGWTVLSIRSDDGCYKVKATNPRGERLEAKYDPGSLELIRRKGKDDDD